ncbi:hypothetical protein VitviT2T_007503 [Vitis vinifera]|uniref:Disease resistance R13L4/SHOC-2-like LRR domain-containing protein n=1 Tax=Vitis vinifera TaxID=29760 RepID=A0ABY9C1T3_VITVI|nr:hypothetical protein VitviT2T_007503 [Vitis vinifera]
MLHEYFTRKEREKVWRMMAEGRNEEAKEMQHRNSPLKMNDTINWAEVHDTRDLVKIVLSRVIEKLYVVRIQEPAVLVGVEEDVQWIQRKLMRVRVKPKYSPEELMDVAYDLEDVIDDLILRSAGKQRGIGNWESCLLIIRIHKKLELIKSKIPALPRLPIIIAAGANHDSYFEEMVWSDIFLLHDRNVANTIVCPVEQKVTALLAQEVIHPHTKKKVMRVLDKFRCLNDFLTGLQSVELDACDMVWMEELSHVALSAVTAIEDFINKKEQFTKRSWMRPSRGFLFAFGKLKYEDKLAVEMDKIYAKIQNLSMHRPTELSRQSQSRDTESTVRISPQPTTQEPNLASFTDDVHAMVKRLPDALRQYWLSKAQQATFLGIHTDTRSELSLGTSRIRRLVDHLDKEDVSFDHIHSDYNTTSTSLAPYYEDVLSFMSFDTRKESQPGEDLGNFLHQSISSGCFLVLLVLDLENVFRPKLPEAIGKLTRLRYFGLRSTFLEILPSSISKLQNVQTLDMKHTSINTLPDSIWKLQQLLHLFLSESYQSKLMLGQGTNFPTILQTLCGLFVDEETPVRDGLDRLLNIRKLGLTMSSKQEAMSLQLQAVVDWVLKQKHSGL